MTACVPAEPTTRFGEEPSKPVSADSVLCGRGEVCRCIWGEENVIVIRLLAFLPSRVALEATGLDSPQPRALILLDATPLSTRAFFIIQACNSDKAMFCSSEWIQSV